LEAQTTKGLGGKEPNMLIIGCDYHPGFQQIAFVDTESGELGERRLLHPEEAEQFYGKLNVQIGRVRVGMEASGHARWFERLLHNLEFELLRVASSVLAVSLVCCSTARSQETLNERENVITALSLSYGRSIDDSKPLFALTAEYVLAPIFSAGGLLIEFSIEPNSSAHSRDPQHSVQLSQPEFESILANVNSIKPLGVLKEEFPAKFGSGSRAWGIQRYQNGYLQTAALISHAPPLPIAFAYIYYLHPVTGIAKIPGDGKPDEAGSFGLVCIGGESYIAPKIEFLKLWSKPNEKQTVELAGPTRDDCGQLH
jgi:hypothetical protein